MRRHEFLGAIGGAAAMPFAARAAAGLRQERPILSAVFNGDGSRRKYWLLSKHSFLQAVRRALAADERNHRIALCDDEGSDLLPALVGRLEDHPKADLRFACIAVRICPNPIARIDLQSFAGRDRAFSEDVIELCCACQNQVKPGFDQTGA
jgi:hypothetical protein